MLNNARPSHEMQSRISGIFHPHSDMFPNLRARVDLCGRPVTKSAGKLLVRCLFDLGQELFPVRPGCMRDEESGHGICDNKAVLERQAAEGGA